jgi:hypothetical protein
MTESAAAWPAAWAAAKARSLDALDAKAAVKSTPDAAAASWALVLPKAWPGTWL